MAKTKNKYTNDDIPVKEIKNGSIILDNGEKVTGIKIMPKNIFILDQSSQDSIIASLRTFYNAIDYEFWLIAADRPVDINVYLSQLELLYNNVSSPAKRKLIMDDINKIWYTDDDDKAKIIAHQGNLGERFKKCK